MALGYQARAMQRGLDHLGEPAFLRGAPAGKVALARSVVLDPGIGDTADDNMVVRHDVATIANEFAPRIGDLLQFIDETSTPIPGEAYVLDRRVSDNRFNSKFIVVKT